MTPTNEHSRSRSRWRAYRSPWQSTGARLQPGVRTKRSNATRTRAGSADSWRRTGSYDVQRSGGRSSTESGDTSPGFVTVGSAKGGTAVRGRVAAAVQEMQGALQAELQEDQLKLYGVIGRGGFGTVYHGASLS